MFMEKAVIYQEAKETILQGRYRHFKGNEYEVIGIARHSEDESPMVVYRALYGDHGLWVRPADMWLETVERDGETYRRFEKVMACPQTISNPSWDSMTYEDKNRLLYERQKKMLAEFRDKHAISQAQYEKSLNDLTEKMGMKDQSAHKETRD